jgi:hypothetical protein
MLTPYSIWYNYTEYVRRNYIDDDTRCKVQQDYRLQMPIMHEQK